MCIYSFQFLLFKTFFISYIHIFMPNNFESRQRDDPERLALRPPQSEVFSFKKQVLETLNTTFQQLATNLIRIRQCWSSGVCTSNYIDIMSVLLIGECPFSFLYRYYLSISTSHTSELRISSTSDFHRRLSLTSHFKHANFTFMLILMYPVLSFIQ